MKTYILSLAIFVNVVTCFAEEPKPQPPIAPPVAPPVAPGIPKPINQPSNPVRPTNPEWMSFLDRLRMQPRPGAIMNGTLNANLLDIFAEGPDTKTKAVEVTDEYEKALLEKAVKFESEMKELRAQYETKLVASLPESKREAAGKFLDESRKKWAAAFDRDSKVRTEHMEKMRNSYRAQQPPLPGQPNTAVAGAAQNKGPNDWLNEQRTKAFKEDDDSVAALRALLSPEDAARFDHFNRPRNPSMMRPPTPGTPIPQIPKPPAPTPQTGNDPKNPGPQEKN